MGLATALIDAYWEEMLAHRRWLHVHPELSGQEKETAAYIAGELRKMGLSPIENVGGCGVIALIEGTKPGKCLGLRADIDALPLAEATDLPFSSENPGVMHACGHDGHAAMLLCVAHILNSMRDRFSGTVKLIFQPSEENVAISGAKRMIADGVLENPRVDAIMGQHLEPGLPIGTISLRSGATSAASDKFYIAVEGKSCHASRPNLGVDAITIGAQIITALQNIVSRNVSPLDCSVLTIGKAYGGTGYNVVAGKYELEGTCRNHNPAVRDEMEKRMESIARGIAEGMGAQCTFRYTRGYSPVINDPEMFELARGVAVGELGKENVVVPEKATLGGEDFSFYAEKVPGIFFRTGCRRTDGPVYPLHSEHFVLNEEGMKVGARVMAECALAYLNRDEGQEIGEGL